MYSTPIGTRVLAAAERRLFVTSLAMIVDDLSTGDCVFEIQAFDDLQRNQQIAVLHACARALLCEDDPAPRLTAFLEAAVATVYRHSRDMLLAELEEEGEEVIPGVSHRLPSWRELVRAACCQAELAEDLPTLDEKDPSEWDILINCLEDQVLWDQDFELAGALEADPDRCERLKDELGIDPDYFVAVPPDPTDAETERLLQELEQLTADVR